MSLAECPWEQNVPDCPCKRTSRQIQCHGLLIASKKQKVQKPARTMPNVGGAVLDSEKLLNSFDPHYFQLTAKWASFATQRKERLRERNECVLQADFKYPKSLPKSKWWVPPPPLFLPKTLFRFFRPPNPVKSILSQGLLDRISNEFLIFPKLYLTVLHLKVLSRKMDQAKSRLIP